MMTRRSVYRAAAMVAALAGGPAAAGCGAAGTAQTPASQATSAEVDVARVVSRALDVTMAMPGELEPYEAVAIYPKVTGFLKMIRVDRGSHVRAGELLAVLEAPELVAQRAEAQSKLQAAEAQLVAARARADADASTGDKLAAAARTPGAVAGNDLLLAQKSAEAARSQATAAAQAVEAARQALASIAEMESYLRITAPFDGVVTERDVHPGALVGPGGQGPPGPMLRIVDARRLRLVVPVPEAYVAGVAAGAAVAFTVPAYPGEPFSGVVARLAQAIDVKTRTMAVELDVRNPDGRLTPGAYCQVRWPVRRPSPSLFVPSGAVASTTDRVFVVRVRGGRAEWVDVRTGVTAGALVEVFGDLHAGDEVAVRGTDELRPETPVRTSEIKPTPS